MHHKLQHPPAVARGDLCHSEGRLLECSEARIIQGQTASQFLDCNGHEAGVSISLIWVGNDFTVVSEQILYQQATQVVHR